MRECEGRDEVEGLIAKEREERESARISQELVKRVS